MSESKWFFMFFFTLKKCREDKSKPSLTYSNKLQVSDALVLIYVQITQYGYINFELTRKYPLRGYILGVLTHTTAWDRIWRGYGTLTMWF